jgi:hypothetical protein
MGAVWTCDGAPSRARSPSRRASGCSCATSTRSSPVTIGALARWVHGRTALATDPYLQLGLANRDKGNRAALFIPVELRVQPTCRWAIELRSGWNSDLEVWRDGWHVPVDLGARVRATSQLDVAASFGFRSLLGPQNNAKERTVFVTVGWRTGDVW